MGGDSWMTMRYERPLDRYDYRYCRHNISQPDNRNCGCNYRNRDYNYGYWFAIHVTKHLWGFWPTVVLILHVVHITRSWKSSSVMRMHGYVDIGYCCAEKKLEIRIATAETILALRECLNVHCYQKSVTRHQHVKGNCLRRGQCLMA